MKRSTIMWLTIGLVAWIRLGFYACSFITIDPEYGWVKGDTGWTMYLGLNYTISILYLLCAWDCREKKWSIFYWIKSLNKYIDNE